jgi:uncharacterized protein YbbC (DUF1343 family)
MKRICLAVTCAVSTLTVSAQVRTGIDVLEEQHFTQLKQIAAKHGNQLRLGILTNPVGIDAHERRTIDVLRQDAAAAVPGLKVIRLFSAEHGINASVDNTHINDSQDPESKLPIVGVFGPTAEQKHPSAKQTDGLDAVVIDLQDVGVRYWTFQTLMQYFLQASAAQNFDVIVLDRPNPVNGVAVQGPLSTPGRESYVNPYAEPVRTGMTMGELAEFFNGEMHIGAHLTVIKMSGWSRTDWYDNTGLLWVNPSPNLRSLTQAMVYPGIGLIEGTNVTVKGPGERVEGVEIVVNNRDVLDAPELGVEAACALWKLYPTNFQVDKVDRLLLNKEVTEQIKAGKDPRDIAASWKPKLEEFKARRAKYLLY